MLELGTTTKLLKILGDTTRLRILNLLAEEELSGTDLVEILNMAQSRIATHLSVLRRESLVSQRRVGRRALYTLADGGHSDFLTRVLGEARSAAEFEIDTRALSALRLRRIENTRSYFDRVAATFAEQILPGRTWEGLARALLMLAPRGRYIDLGVGDGLLTMMLTQVAESVTAVDLSEEMLKNLEARARAQGVENIEYVIGEIEQVPLPDAQADVVVMSQALHHAEVPEKSIAEAMRLLRPGGRLLVIDLLQHTEAWVREKLQHQHLGFSQSDLEDLLSGSGFEYVSVHNAARDPHPPHFVTLVATGSKPS
ncbi:MAG: 2-polyprenyl-3-methyl-5-hydroxy-6-metoxy-1,4-benzoquinol methylase [Chlamydiales bacterium]|jgi:2-polyprenyl-3-methyl-5-hydroxy-6-metoxy-1,4-benzoquinol methylase